MTQIHIIKVMLLSEIFGQKSTSYLSTRLTTASKVRSELCVDHPWKYDSYPPNLHSTYLYLCTIINFGRKNARKSFSIIYPDISSRCTNMYIIHS